MNPAVQQILLSREFLKSTQEIIYYVLCGEGAALTGTKKTFYLTELYIKFKILIIFFLI